MMRLVETAKLLLSHLLWLGLHLRPAGRALINALGSDDEDSRIIAGMLLVRAGSRAVPLLRNALTDRQNLPIVIQIIADIGAREFESQLRTFENDPDPKISQAARTSLQQLRSSQGQAI